MGVPYASGPRAQVRDGWWKWDLIPDNEKYFFYHVLNSRLYPRANALEVLNPRWEMCVCLVYLATPWCASPI